MKRRFMRDIFEDFDDSREEQSIKQSRYSDGYIIELPYSAKCIADCQKIMDVELLSKEGILRYYCASLDAALSLVKRSISVDNILKSSALYNKGNDRIVIYQANNSMNDSLHESDAIYEYRTTANTFNKMRKSDTPKSYHKRLLISAILDGSIDRTEDAIERYFWNNGVWDGTTKEHIKRHDVQEVLDKTVNASRNCNGEFIVDITYNKDDNYNANTGEYRSEEEFVEGQIKFLRECGMEVRTEPRRYSTVVFIKYKNAAEYENLARWLTYFFAIVPNINQPVNQECRNRMYEIIDSGKHCTWRYRDIYKPGDPENLNPYSGYDDDEEEEDFNFNK